MTPFKNLHDKPLPPCDICGTKERGIVKRNQKVFCAECFKKVLEKNHAGKL